MANPEHLEILRQSVDTWNKWRKDAGLREADLIEAEGRDAGLRPDLSEANLCKEDLSEANLRDVNLRGADLSGANLSRVKLGGADLGGADLREADLIDARLTGAYLREAKLRNADLSGAKLREAYLRGADLSGAALSDADLSGADLTNADLRETVLCGANLSGADFSGADLREAYLHDANLSDANLSGADLSHSNLQTATLFETLFINVDLTTVKGLETCQHHGPSTLDYRTLAQSGRLPLAFLRGCGLPDMLIDYLPSLQFPVRLVGFETLRDWECFDADAGKDSAREIREFYVPDFSSWKDHDAYQREFEKLLRDLKSEKGKILDGLRDR